MMRRGVGVVVVVACVQLAAADGKPTAALDKPAMTATASELLAVAKAAPTGDVEVDVLREDVDTGIDERGCVTSRRRWVFVVRTQQDLGDWDTLQAAWDPSYQNKPTIRARVIAPAGSIALLDATAITEPTQAPATAAHWRTVQGALPPLQIGSIVEEEIVTVDREPALAIGGLSTTQLGGGTPAASTVITLSAPAGRKARQVARKLPASARTEHRIEHGREIWRTEVGALPGVSSLQADAPHDVATTPYVGLATNASWAAVASAYRAAVDKRIAEGPFALPAELPRTPSIETARAITAWLHRTIRSSPTDFAPDLALPDSPAEVVRRGTGSDDDRAALLISLLRQAGLTADLVLVAGGGMPPDPELPGLAAFRRTLVRVRVGAGEAWIDPGEPLARVGELQARDRDRRALVIANETRALRATPDAVAADNVTREVRTFVAAELGPAQITEVMRVTGAFEIEQRRWERRVTPAAKTKHAADYARAQYDGELVRRTATAADDLDTPNEVTIEIKDAHRMYTEREQISVFLYPNATLDKLPWIVTQRAEQPRTADFVWPTPHVYEIENRISVPPGYTLPAPAPDRTRAIGSARFTEHQEVSGQSLVVTFRFDSGKRRLTAAELGQLQDAVTGLRNEVVQIKIDLTSAALSYAGKPREAIAEAERLVALHPREAVHHDQLAQVLLRAGAGEAARREARRAVALAPADPDAQAVLGWILSCDTLGRSYGFDWDRAGSIAALQQARKLEPKHVGAALQLSDVALHNAHGRAFEPGADLELALDAARAALALDKTDAHALAVVKLLAWLGRYAEAATLAETVTSNAKDPWLVAAEAALRSPAAAIQKAGSLRSGAERGKLIGEASAMLMVLRLYEPARALLAETGTLARGGPFEVLMSHLAVQPSLPATSKDPLDATRLAMAACADPDREAKVFWSPVVEKHFRRDCAALKTVRRDWMTGTFIADLLVSNLALKVEGDAAAWRVRGEFAGQPVRLYLTLDHGSAKILGEPKTWSGVGSYLARLLDHGRDDVVRRVLDWLAEDLDPQQPATNMFKRLWGAGLPTDRAQMQRATALLVGEGDVEVERALALLGTCSSTIASADEACHQVRLAVYYRARRWADFENEYTAMIATVPMTRAAWRWRVTALLKLARFDDADRAIDDVLAGNPDDGDARNARVAVAVLRGAPDEALRRADALTTGTSPRAGELNTAAWLRVALDRDLDGALDLARRALAQDATAFGVRNTLAVAEVEHGDLAAAMADGWKVMADAIHAAPRNADWYLVGRLYERLGLASDAVAAYRHITADESYWGGSYELAAKRLTALHASH